MVEMVVIEFPLTGPLRMPILVLEWIFAFIIFELGLIFLLKYRSRRTQFRAVEELGFAVLFFGFSFMQFLAILGNFFLPNTPEPFLWRSGTMRDLFLAIGYFILLVSIIVFINVMERTKQYFLKQYFFTYTTLILLASSVVPFFIDLKLLNYFFYAVWLILFLFLIIYFVKFFKGAEDSRAQIIKVSLFFLMVFVGIIISSEKVMTFVGLELGLGGAICQFIAIVCLVYLFLKMPPFSEFEWKGKIDELLIMTKAGVCIYHKYFIDKVSHLSDVMVSGALIGVNIMIDELTATEKKGMSIIKKKDKIVNLFSSSELVGVLISTEELKSINYYLKAFIQKVESIYQNILLNWDGQIEVFAALENLVVEQFT